MKFWRNKEAMTWQKFREEKAKFEQENKEYYAKKQKQEAEEEQARTKENM